MKNRIQKLVAPALLALLGAPLANAAAPSGGNWEISAGPGVDVRFGSFSGTSGTGSNSTSISINGAVTGEVGYLVQPQLEIVVNPHFRSTSSGGTTSSTYSVQAGLNYSFSPDVHDSAFLEATAGFYRFPIFTAIQGGAVTVDHGTSFIYTADLGKRFALGESVSFRPSIKWQSYGGDISSHYLSFVPLYFSFFL